MDPGSPKDWKILEARPALQGEGRVVSIVNQKGGVAKTTTTVNVAAGLALRGHRVLIVDIDPQANATTGLGQPREREGPSTYDVILDDLPLEDAVVSSQIAGLDLVPASSDLAGAEVELVAALDRERRLQRALQSGTGRYDVIFVDCPPSLGLLTVNALVGAHDLIVPVQCEYYALEGLGQLLGNAERVRRGLNPDLRIFGFLLTMFDARTRLASQVEDEVRKHFGKLVFETRIPRSVRISEAPSYGEPVLTLDPSSRGSVAYRLLAAEVEARYGFAKKTPPPPPPPPGGQREPMTPPPPTIPTAVPGPGGRGYGTVAPEPQGLAEAWPPSEPWTVEAR
ncbi:MAG: chromosome partitioning protein [Actinomycetota bacterium]|nr:chromosome partitioning protein [Actinomycetota bacterium]